MEKIFDRFTEKDIRTTAAYLILMGCLSTVAYFCLFTYMDTQIRQTLFSGLDKTVRISIILTGLISLLSILFISYKFTRGVLLKKFSAEQIIMNALASIEFPTIVSRANKKLKIVLANNSAIDFYGTKLVGKKYSELDENIIGNLENAGEWTKEHEERVKIASKGKLDSTSWITMKFKKAHQGHKEWRLTSCKMKLGTKIDYYLTIISPAIEDDGEQNKGPRKNS